VFKVVNRKCYSFVLSRKPHETPLQDAFISILYVSTLHVCNKLINKTIKRNRQMRTILSNFPRQTWYKIPNMSSHRVFNFIAQHKISEVPEKECGLQLGIPNTIRTCKRRIPWGKWAKFMAGTYAGCKYGSRIRNGHIYMKWMNKYCLVWCPKNSSSPLYNSSWNKSKLSKIQIRSKKFQKLLIFLMTD
jgi:hypothetical protein